MSNYDINSNPALVRAIIEKFKECESHCPADAVVPLFENELRELGFQFEISAQVANYLPKYKDEILPIAIKYYHIAKYDNEKNYFVGLFHYKGFEEVVPMLLADVYSEDTLPLTREFICESLRVISSKKYIDDYIKIISTPKYGIARFPIFYLIEKLKPESAVPVLLKLLESDDTVEYLILRVLKAYKRSEFRPIFERYLDSPNKNLQKVAISAISKLK